MYNKIRLSEKFAFTPIDINNLGSAKDAQNFIDSYAHHHRFHENEDHSFIMIDPNCYQCCQSVHKNLEAGVPEEYLMKYVKQ